MAHDADASRTPLYAQVKRELLAAIASGEYSPGVPFVTQREICERFDVSHATAVRALNELAAEGWVVRRRGQGTFVAEQPGRPPGPAGGAAGRGGPGGRGTGPDRSVACVLQLPGPHVAALLAGAEAVCAEHGYRLYLRYCDGDPAREAQALRDALADGVSGILVYPAQGTGDPSGYHAVAEAGTPLVMLDRHRPDLAYDAVVADNFAAGRDLTDALVAAGHTTMATLWDETDVSSVRDRLAGHVHALRAHGLPVRPDLTVLRRYADLPAEERRARLAELMAGERPPTVLVCANGFVLAAAAQDLLALGYEIPGDVDLAGMDDAGPFDILPLTAAAITLPSREMGETAMRRLHQRVTEGRRPGERSATELIEVPVAVRTRRSAPGHLRVVGAEAAGA